MSYQTTNRVPSLFMINPKRKSSRIHEAYMYMRITYGVNSIEKSLGISINYENWDSDIKQVTEIPMHDHQLKQKVEEYKQLWKLFICLPNMEVNLH